MGDNNIIMTTQIYFKVGESFFDQWLVKMDAAMGFPSNIANTYTWKKNHPTDETETKVIGSLKLSIDDPSIVNNQPAIDAIQEMLDEMSRLYGSENLLTRSELEDEDWFYVEEEII